ncbi:MAG: hypothetical protein RL215_2762 [Planctomycetota bacterium]
MRLPIVCLLLVAVLQSALIASLQAVVGCVVHKDAAGLPHLHAGRNLHHSHSHRHAASHSHSHSHHHKFRQSSRSTTPAARSDLHCGGLESPHEHESDAIYLTELTVQTRRPLEPAGPVMSPDVLSTHSALNSAAALSRHFPAASRPALGGLTICLIGCSLRL